MVGMAANANDLLTMFRNLQKADKNLWYTVMLEIVNQSLSHTGASCLYNQVTLKEAGMN